MSRINSYFKWMAINSWATSISMVLSTNSMLSSITNPSYSSVLATAYIGKDIIGQLGGLGYVWKNSKKSDKEPYVHVSKGILLQQLSFYLEDFSVNIGENAIIPYLGVTSAMKNVSFIKIGAVNAYNLKNISENKIGEMYTKMASINTIASSVGMLCGLGLIYMIPCHEIRSATTMPFLSAISLYSIQKATKLCE